MADLHSEDTFLAVRASLALPNIQTRSSRASMSPSAVCRRRTLKVINSRPVLMAICTFVVIECVCVLAELMVDLQGIKFRFENEEKELNRFVEFLRTKYPEEFATWKDAGNVEDVINKIKDSLIVRPDNNKTSPSQSCPCVCTGSSQQHEGFNSAAIKSGEGEGGKGERAGTDHKTHSEKSGLSSSQQSHNAGSASAYNVSSSLTRVPFNPEDVFVLEINNIKESFFLVAEYAPAHIKLNDTKHHHYETEYQRIHKASTALHITSLVILSFMVIETIAKFVCMGTAFLKKKFEVFDAFIVISSFALDFVFLDSRWYETGKDATTILVLLLPWRVVRIVNSFLMTVKHKHHLSMMTIKRAKKRADFKNAKLQALLTEIRKDVQLLVALCRNSHLPESEITSCLYGLGRRSTTLNAVTSCTTIMLVSALGKDASLEDEIYGRLFADALQDPIDNDSEPEAKKAEEEALDAAIELDRQIEQQNKKAARAAIKPRPAKRRRGHVTRSYTVPRRSASIEDTIEADNGSSIFYVNDAFTTHRASGARAKKGGVSSAETLAGLAGGPQCLAVTRNGESRSREGGEDTLSAGGKDSWEGRLPPRCKSKASVRSLPGPGSGHNMVTFEVTTQVTYL